MKSLLLVPVLLLLFVLGCASNSKVLVEIFRDGEKPSRPHREIMLLTDDGTLAEQGEIERKMIATARKNGADALIFEKMIRTGEEIRGFGLAETYLYKARAVVFE